MFSLKNRSKRTNGTSDAFQTKRRGMSRLDLYFGMISMMILLSTFVVFKVQDTSHFVEMIEATSNALSSFTETQMNERLLLSKSVPTVMECKDPLRMAVPLLRSEQQYSKKHRSRAKPTMRSNRKPPRVCIIATTYNVVDYVGIAVESVLQQTYQNVEIIVVDDNSNDGTSSLLIEQYATAPPGPDTVTPTLQVIALTHNTNGGAGQPSNIGIDSCSDYTEYVMLADGDDYMELDAVEVMVTHAETFNSDIVMADFDVVIPLPNGTVVSEPSYDFRHWDEIPTDVPFNILTHPRVLRTSPVPWRKMYRRKMLMKYDLRFPEGDYFYEDNAFHWRTLTHAARCSKIDRVLFHHRRARKGQTSFNFNQPDGEAVVMSMEWFRRYTSVAKIGGYYPNQYAIGRGLFPETSALDLDGIECLPPVAPKEVATTYFDWLSSSAWIGQKQITHQMRDKFYRRLDQVRRHWGAQQDIIVPDGYWLTVNNPANLNLSWLKRPKTIDLSIIMPTVNVAEFINSVLDDMYERLFKPDFTFEVFAIDDGSTDNTAEILRDYADDHKHNFYFLSTLSSNGAGKARNLALPLVEGRYVYCVDADDSYDFEALAEAVDYATKHKKDVMMLPYFVEYVDADKKAKKTGMMKGDERIWAAVRSEKEPTHSMQKRAALGLINYPWKQLTSSKLLFDADVFFGPTKVHNDVQFHWTSIAASKNVHFYDKEVCSHRKFDSAVRGQLTEVKSETRMGVFASLGMTQRALARNGAFDGEEGATIVFPLWREFCIHLLKWAKTRVPASSNTMFQAKQAHLLSILEADPQPQSSELRRWAYWGERFVQNPISEQE